MIKRIFKCTICFLYLATFCIVLSCSKSDDDTNRIEDENNKSEPVALSVNSISKNRGMGGDILEIYGSGFGENASALKVKFAVSLTTDTLIGEIDKITPTQLTVRVPDMYTDKRITVFVVGNGTVSNKFPFTCDMDAVDSTAIVRANWISTEVKEGIIWRKTSFKAFKSNQNIHVVEVDQSMPLEAGILYSTPVGTGKRTSSFASEVDATVAINGSYYSAGKAAIGHLRVNGIDVENGTNWNERINASLVINNNKLSIHYLGTNGYNQVSRELPGEHVMACGPSLLVDGTYIKTMKLDDAHVLNRHPRTAVGITTDNKILLVTVDGRKVAGSDGVNLRELSVIMRALRAKDAMNLDGGGSTTMYIKNHGVVNNVSGGSERAVANALYVK